MPLEVLVILLVAIGALLLMGGIMLSPMSWETEKKKRKVASVVIILCGYATMIGAVVVGVVKTVLEYGA